MMHKIATSRRIKPRSWSLISIKSINRNQSLSTQSSSSSPSTQSSSPSPLLPSDTKFTRLLGCKYPLVLPGMSWISTAELVVAVSNAGGVGILATGPLSPSKTRDSIHQIKELAPNKPFGVGITLLMPGARENAQIALEEHVPLINVSLGLDSDIVNKAHSYGGKILSTITNAHHAERALAKGADALLATGHEAAAHGGDVTSLVLLASLSERHPNIPLIGAGGFANGKGLASALSLGADAVAMGTRFACTYESPLALPIKKELSSSDWTESDTIYGKNFDGLYARVMKTSVAQKVNARRPPIPLIIYRAFMAARSMNIPLWKVLPGLWTDFDKLFAVAQFGAATEALQAATVDGDLYERGVQFAGQSMGLVHDIPTVEELVNRIMEEAYDSSLSTVHMLHANSQQQQQQQQQQPEEQRVV